MARPASGPSIRATAMARFISRIGERVCWASVWYSAATGRQSRGSCRCRPVMAAWSGQGQKVRS